MLHSKIHNRQKYASVLIVYQSLKFSIDLLSIDPRMQIRSYEVSTTRWYSCELVVYFDDELWSVGLCFRGSRERGNGINITPKDADWNNNSNKHQEIHT